MTTPVGARPGLVRCQRDVDTHRGTLTRRGRGPPLLPPSRPGDLRLVLGLRPRDLPGLHDVRPGRDPLPGSRGRRRARAGRRRGPPGARRDRSSATARSSPSRSSGSTSACSCSSCCSAAQLNGTGNWIYENGVLFGPIVADGEWWRLVTAPFLHYGPLHLGMNMLVLWFIGPALESYLGHWRYLLLYVVSGLAGSAGALIWSPNALTVGASGRDLGAHGRGAHPRVAPDLRVRRAGARARRPEPRAHVPHPGGLDRRAHRRPHRRRRRDPRLPRAPPDARARHARGRRSRRAEHRRRRWPPSRAQPAHLEPVPRTSMRATIRRRRPARAQARPGSRRAVGHAPPVSASRSRRADLPLRPRR